jgi:dsDNA-specific endonuclease/ATPase MutS2
MAVASPGESVQTPLGKGVILEVRNRRVLVQIQDRAVLLNARDVTPIAPPKAAAARPATPAAARPTTAASATRPGGRRTPPPSAVPTIDLHGLTVVEALDAVIAAIDAALRNDAASLRVIHGRSGGRLRTHLRRPERPAVSMRSAWVCRTICIGDVTCPALRSRLSG